MQNGRSTGVVLARTTLRPANAANHAAQGFAPLGPKQQEMRRRKEHISQKRKRSVNGRANHHYRDYVASVIDHTMNGD
jgi:hypothetical protein